MFRPDAVLPNGLPLTPRLMIDLITELPEDSAFVASLRASLPPPAAESPATASIRGRRRYRGWTTDTELIARVGDALIGKRFPRPGDDGVSVGDRQVVDLDDLPI